MNNTQQRAKVLQYIQSTPARSTSEIAAALGIPEHATSNLISQLHNRGLVRREYVNHGRKLNRVFAVDPTQSGFGEDE